MMETKTQWKLFSIFAWEKEQAYLRKMHGDGWKLVKVTGPGRYHFEKCPPQDVVYQLDYNKDGLASKAEYRKLFEDCGWEYIQDFVGYSYFRKPVTTDGVAEEIFSDRESKLRMLGFVLKNRMLPLLILFFTVLLPLFLLELAEKCYLAAAFLGAALGLYLLIFAISAWQYWKCKNAGA